MFEDVFDEKIVNISDLPSDLIDLTNINLLEQKDANQNVTLKSNSTCSSRSSYTDNGEEHDDCDDCVTYYDRAAYYDCDVHVNVDD